MKLKHVLLVLVLIPTILVLGCISQESEKPEDVLSVSELLENPVYDTEITIYGEVSLLGELFCPCFELTSGGKTVQVWYDLMVEDDGKERPPVSVEEIENGDLVTVTGELKTEGKHRSRNDFWASSIQYQNSAADESVIIAIYSDQGAAESCIQATTNMFEWMGYTVRLVKAVHINNEKLDNFSILCIPGGDMYQYSQDISSTGKENIRNFIRDGGSYIGICGGAYFTGEKVIWQGDQLPMIPLRIFPGTTQGPIDEIAPYPYCIMCEVSIMDHSHPITQSEGPLWIAYCYGPMFLPNENADIDVLGEYEIVNQPAMVAFEYGKGKVFIIGTHPEFEEDSERDGLPIEDELDDQGSDWELMRKAVLWCLEK